MAIVIAVVLSSQVYNGVRGIATRRCRFVICLLVALQQRRRNGDYRR